MSVNVNDEIRKLSHTQRKKVEARAAELIAEEIDLATTPKGARAYPDAHSEEIRNHASQRLSPGKAE